MNRRFIGKTVVITGASSGIGAAVAKRFAKEGARVVLAARRKELLENVSRAIGEDKTMVVPTDVRDLTSAAALLEKAEERFGRVDILVNNAGAHALGPIEDRSVDELMTVVDVNVRSVVALCRMAIPYLRRAGGGAIVNVASLAGRVPISGAATYCATKFALRGFSLSLAEELKGSGITVSVVSPGPVDTDFMIAEVDNVPDIVFSLPISSPRRVAAGVLACAYDGKAERTIPAYGGAASTFGYVFPRMWRLLGPLLKRLGRFNKRRYLRRRGMC